MEDNTLINIIKETVRAEVQSASKEFFTPMEAASFLNITKPYLYKLVSEGAISYSKPGGKMIYFSRRDLVAYALSNHRAGAGEIESRAATIMATSNRK